MPSCIAPPWSQEACIFPRSHLLSASSMHIQRMLGCKTAQVALGQTDKHLNCSWWLDIPFICLHPHAELHLALPQPWQQAGGPGELGWDRTVRTCEVTTAPGQEAVSQHRQEWQRALCVGWFLVAVSQQTEFWCWPCPRAENVGDRIPGDGMLVVAIPFHRGW